MPEWIAGLLSRSWAARGINSRPPSFPFPCLAINQTWMPRGVCVCVCDVSVRAYTCVVRVCSRWIASVDSSIELFLSLVFALKLFYLLLLSRRPVSSTTPKTWNKWKLMRWIVMHYCTFDRTMEREYNWRMEPTVGITTKFARARTVLKKYYNLVLYF